VRWCPINCIKALKAKDVDCNDGDNVDDDDYLKIQDMRVSGTS